MFAQCPICFEDLDVYNTPVAMPCGHLYCLDCATFWFNQNEIPQKCTCGRMFNGDDIIKLWTGASDPESQAGRASSSSTPIRRGSTVTGRAAVAACNAALQEPEAWRNSNVLTDALSQTGRYLDFASGGDPDVGMQNILKSLRALLSEIHTTLQQQQQHTQGANIQTAADPDREDRLHSAAKELRLLKAKMARDIQEIYHQSLVQEESARREITIHEEREQELSQKLHDTRRALDTVRRHLESSRVSETKLGEEVERLRKSEYHALKQDMAAIKRAAGGRTEEYEDDSLLVI
ncbi:hypothetical protein EIP86_004387 [Pleurotus ostreatoroseus]|nr:hypothetical protein EIP86_004387 [Pleurotus ostreatoroseus]